MQTLPEYYVNIFLTITQFVPASHSLCLEFNRNKDHTVRKQLVKVTVGVVGY